MMNALRLLSLLLLFSACSNSPAPGTANADSGTKAPAATPPEAAPPAPAPAADFKISYPVEKDICPFEYGCSFSRILLKDELPVYATEGDTTKVAFRSTINDTFYIGAKNMHIERPGKVKLLKPAEGFKVNDTIRVLSYRGEGFYDVEFKGEIKLVSSFWNETPQPRFQGLLLQAARMSWWVEVKRNGQTAGWVRLVNDSDNGIQFRYKIKFLK